MKLSALQTIRQLLLALESRMLAETKRLLLFKNLHPDQQYAAQNLLHYLVLRNEDIRELQEMLHIHGLSSLASAESHIHRQLQAILERLGHKYTPAQLDPCTYAFSKNCIEATSTQLFGERRTSDTPFIMVTFDVSFADNYQVIKQLLQSGMNVARINCAHDEEHTWLKMIRNIKKAARNTGLNCKIYMDLAGPKIRVKLLNKGRDKGKVNVEKGDLIWLAYENTGFGKNDVVISPNEPGIIEILKKGERVLIDDGIVQAVVEKVKKTRVGIRITRISSEKKRIKAEKGINFPDSELVVPSLTHYDQQCLPFVCANADLVGYSFVQNATDVAHLQQLLRNITDTPPYIILKIETLEAVLNLPALLLKGMEEHAFGVMIARGDLAVEIGFERMGEIQEEILWICEAAHVPVVWATQVLENLNKSGMATRSEITDAGHAALADCVMINKGDHTLEVLETLKDILQRTSEHRIKKRYTFRPLRIATRFLRQE